MTFTDFKCFLFLIYTTFMLIYLSWLVFSKAMGIGSSTYLNGSPCPFLEARLSSVPLTKWCLHLPNCSARHLQALPDHILWPAESLEHQVCLFQLVAQLLHPMSLPPRPHCLHTPRASSSFSLNLFPISVLIVKTVLWYQLNNSTLQFKALQ